MVCCFILDIAFIVRYHLRELPQVYFLSRQIRVCHDKTSFVATKYACRAKRFVTSWQACFCRDKRHVLYACPDKTFVATKLCMSQQIFVATTIFCRVKHNFAATSMLLSRQKTCFVAKNTCFSREKLCRENFLLVAVPANDSPWPDAIQACALVSTVAVHQRQQHTRAVAVCRTASVQSSAVSKNNINSKFSIKISMFRSL